MSFMIAGAQSVYPFCSPKLIFDLLLCVFDHLERKFILAQMMYLFLI